MTEHRTEEKDIFATVTSNVCGSKFGYMVFENGKCVLDAYPQFTKEQAQKELAEWLTREGKAA